MKKLKDGFPEQRLVVISRELLKRQNKLLISRHLHVTDIGHFPHTENHFVSRKSGIFQYIMIFCASGLGSVILNGNKREMSAGQLIIIPPGTPHRYEADIAIPWNIYWFHFAGDQAPEYAELLGQNEQNPVIQVSDIDELVRRFERLYSAVVSAFSDSALVQASVELTETLCLINTLRTGRHRKSRQSEQRILKSIEYITRHYEQPHSLDELARQAGLSVPHYVSLFRKQTGTPPLRYLTRVRLRHACERLDLSDDPVAEIARTVGYEDAFYFSRIFKKSIGHSPSNYRKLNKDSFSRFRQPVTGELD
ncbi:MAG: AraC family transcriptional regulator [Pontiellaceae bacterium]|nr:AraC family transcriptional regulator [Pontiellaceae bacterium]MBN2783861.1 AraC family transcriptional regulator [Pontiellaceae bacterium]